MAVLGWNVKLVTWDHFLDKVEADHFLKDLQSFFFSVLSRHKARCLSAIRFSGDQVRNAETWPSVNEPVWSSWLHIVPRSFSELFRCHLNTYTHPQIVVWDSSLPHCRSHLVRTLYSKAMGWNYRPLSEQTEWTEVPECLSLAKSDHAGGIASLMFLLWSEEFSLHLSGLTRFCQAPTWAS